MKNNSNIFDLFQIEVQFIPSEIPSMLKFALAHLFIDFFCVCLHGSFGLFFALVCSSMHCPALPSSALPRSALVLCCVVLWNEFLMNRRLFTAFVSTRQ